MTSKSPIFQDHHGDVRSRLKGEPAGHAQDLRAGGQFPFPISPNFFYKRFQFPFLASLQFFFFFCKLNTDEVMSAYKRRLQLCFRGGSAAGEQQAPPIEEQRKCIVNSGRCVFSSDPAVSS